MKNCPISSSVSQISILVLSMAHSNLKQPMGQNCNIGDSINHSRSLSQPTFFGNNCLPPLSPFPPSESSLASSNSKSLKDVSMEEIDVSSRPPVPPSFHRESHPFRGNDSSGNNTLPPRKGHRRSNSDVPLGFSAMIQSSPQLVPISGKGIPGKMENMGENNKPAELKMRETGMVSYGGKNNLEGFGDKKFEGEVVDELFNSFMNLGHMDNMDKGSVVSGIKLSGSSNNDNFESLGVKRSATGDIAPPARHYRSLSMDSGIGKFHLGDEYPKLQASPCSTDQLSPSNSYSDNSANKLNLDFAHAEFTELEIKKIMSDERLAEVAVSDPKRAKRILANRQSAARSKERKLRYISELEHKVQTLQTEATTLSAQVTVMQKDYSELTNQNNELKFRLQAMEQQAQLRDALHEALNAEVQRLKLANMELREKTSNTIMQQQQNTMKHQLFTMQQQPNQMQQRLSSQTSSNSTTTSSTAPA